MGVIKKGTYRFNDELPIPSWIGEGVDIPIEFTTRYLFGFDGTTLIPDDTSVDLNTIRLSLYEGALAVEEAYIENGGATRTYPCYLGGIGWNAQKNRLEEAGYANYELAKGFGQIINVTKDTVIEDENVADWLEENLKTKMFTRLNVGETVYSSGGKGFKRLVTEVAELPPTDEPSEEFVPFTVTSSNRGMIGYTDNTTELIIPERFRDQEGTLYRVVKIGTSAFSGCSSLTSIAIPDSVTSIGYMAFYDCDSLTSIEIPDSVKSIGDRAFYSSGRLEDVYYTGSVEDWCNISFEDSTSNPMFFGGNLYFGGELVTEIVIPDSVTSIGEAAFYGCTSLTSIAIPDSVTSIGYMAFLGCDSLTSVVIGNSVTSIGGAAFDHCSSLSSIEIPDSVTSIGNAAFLGCSSLTSVVIPDSVTSIGNSAFFGCDSLTSVVIGDGVTSIGNSAFYLCKSLASIKYRGTEAEWAAISKGTNWDKNTGNYTITYNYTGD